MPRREPITPLTLRSRVGLTQRQVAAALNKRVQTISEWERGARPRIHLSEALLMCRVYQTSLENLVEAFDRIDPNDV